MYLPDLQYLCFFMVSGYFCFRGDDTEFIRTGKKIRHVLKLMLVAFPVCCLWELIQNHIDGASQKEWLEALVSGEHIRQFLLYNNSSQVKWHLWFLPALLYCYLLFALAARLRICKQAYVLIPVLLLIHFGIGGIFDIPVPGKAFRVMQFRNYLFTGFPFFMLGHLIHRHQEKLEAWFAGKKSASFVWHGSWRRDRKSAGIQVFWQTGIVSGFSIYGCWSFSHCDHGKESESARAFRQPSVRNMHFFIYLFHLCVADILKDVAVAAGIEKNLLYLWMRPVMVCVFCDCCGGNVWIWNEDLPEIEEFMVFSYLCAVILYQNMLKYPLLISHSTPGGSRGKRLEYPASG